MKLADWLKKTKTQRYKFARRIGVSASVVTDYCEGRYYPRREIAEAIMRETKGEVTANDFLQMETTTAQPEEAAP